ncbi:hypothetical protein NJBCHELONAE_43730 [Mycobacteroides chelonae]|uniref:hypothetical protein n=1 Tax=Mycobacteroides chelonae TaxID=1774 RepID=UPI0021DEC18F|nr:hypothetical protein [Mycobacteroides chelonae]GLE59062.1 hypothetical protein NJBCHELONAE_43730 [Mycobacteroides chelonae]
MDIDTTVEDQRKIVILCPRNTERVSAKAGSAILLRPTKIECTWLSHWHHSGQHHPFYLLTGPRILATGREGRDIARTYARITQPNEIPPSWVLEATDPHRPAWALGA